MKQKRDFIRLSSFLFGYKIRDKNNEQDHPIFGFAPVQTLAIRCRPHQDDLLGRVFCFYRRLV